MPKLGRRLAEDEGLIRTRLLRLIPRDPPGSRFSELVRAAKATGLSKPTLWRHLTRFEELGIVLHEGKFYRRNPLHGGHAQISVRRRILSADGKTARSTVAQIDDRLLRSLAVMDRWGPKNLFEYVAREREAELDVSKPDRVFALLCEAINEALCGYLLVLEGVRGIPDFSRAQEYVNLMIDVEVKSYFLALARLVWEKRQVATFDDLYGREIKLTIEGPAASRPN